MNSKDLLEHQKNVGIWYKDNGEETLRLDYNLDKNSLVIDAGGYKGEWAEKIYNKYHCNIYIYEPIKKYYNLIKEKFKNNSKIKVFNVGLSNQNKTVNISLLDDSSSVYAEEGQKEKIELVDVNDFFKKIELDQIDLFKVNVEGEEYNILERMIESDMIKNVTNLQIQFHRITNNYILRKKQIESHLLKSHYKTYDYDYVWVNFQKK